MCLWITSTKDSLDPTLKHMICIKTEIPKELSEIDDELKAIYHSKDTVCCFIFKTRELRNKFIEQTKGMNKSERERVYTQYNNK